MRPTRVLIVSLVAALLIPGAALAAPGDPYVVYTANNYADGAVILRTDPAAGSLVEISRNGPQGTLFRRPFDLALEADGDLIVADMGIPCTSDLPRCENDGRIIRVDPVTGRQSLLASGAPLLDPAGVAIAPGGEIFVVDNLAADDDGGVIRIHPVTGAKTLLTQGNLLDLPFGILVDRDGSLIVANRESPNSGCGGVPGSVVRVQLADGGQQVISMGGFLKYPLGVALDSDGNTVIANECGPNGLLRVVSLGLHNPITSNNASDVLVTPERLALDPAGDFLVSDFSVGDGDGGIVAVDSATGAQSLLRGGELFNHPLGIAAVVNRPPAAGLTLTPSTVQAGKPVSIDATGSNDPEGLRLAYEWDLDGDGVFETGSGALAATSRAFGVDGRVTVRVRVNDPHGGRAVAEGLINVDGSVPIITRLRTGSRVLAVGTKRLRSRKRPPTATRLSFQLSEAAEVSIAVERLVKGRRPRSGAPCRARGTGLGPGRSDAIAQARRGGRCLRWSRVRTLERAGDAGANSVRIKSRGLKPGRHRLVVNAVDGVGNRAVERRLDLRVVSASARLGRARSDVPSG